MDQDTIKIKVLGERATGINFLSGLLQDDFSVTLYPNISDPSKIQKELLPGRISIGWSSRRARRILDENHATSFATNGGWKHAAIGPDFIQQFIETQPLVVVCMVRRPVSWATSTHKKPIHGIGRVPRRFEDFLSAPRVCAARDVLPSRIAGSPIAMYPNKVENYASLKKVTAHQYS
ncbi:MAG: hypothetical protein ABJO67_19940 [Pseudoruegeria sp.]